MDWSDMQEKSNENTSLQCQEKDDGCLEDVFFGGEEF